MRTYLMAVAGLVVLVMLLGMLGCSGDGSGASSGSIGVSIMFPPRDGEIGPSAEKSMPEVTNSVVIEVTSLRDDVDWERRRTLNRPENGDVVRTTIDSVPGGAVLVTATCYDGYDATGNRVGEASSVVTVVANETTPVTLTTDRLAANVSIYEVPMPDGDPPPVLEEVRLEPTGQQQIQAKGWDFDGTETAYVQFEWAVSEQQPGSVMKGSGLSVDPTTGSVVAITAIEDGRYEVRVRDAKSGQSGTLDVHVISRAVDSVSLSDREATLYRYGEQSQLQIDAEALDSDSTPIDYAEIRYESSDSDVASVSATGLVTAEAQGTCIITVTGRTATGTAGAICYIQVIETGELDVIVQ